jgi:hypothetical protein
MNTKVDNLKIDQEFKTKLLVVVEKMIKDYANFSDRVLEGHVLGHGYYFEDGRNYIKIVKHNGEGEKRSTAGWIVKKDTKKFRKGDMLKSASWKAPATNFARGNVFDNMPERIMWTGIQ